MLTITNKILILKKFTTYYCKKGKLKFEGFENQKLEIC
jgi:hypothetical protein